MQNKRHCLQAKLGYRLVCIQNSFERDEFSCHCHSPPNVFDLDKLSQWSIKQARMYLQKDIRVKDGNSSLLQGKIVFKAGLNPKTVKLG